MVQTFMFLQVKWGTWDEIQVPPFVDLGQSQLCMNLGSEPSDSISLYLSLIHKNQNLKKIRGNIKWIILIITYLEEMKAKIQVLLSNRVLTGGGRDKLWTGAGQ